jgi:hypothetical protein
MVRMTQRTSTNPDRYEDFIVMAQQGSEPRLVFSWPVEFEEYRNPSVEGLKPAEETTILVLKNRSSPASDSYCGWTSVHMDQFCGYPRIDAVGALESFPEGKFSIRGISPHVARKVRELTGPITVRRVVELKGIDIHIGVSASDVATGIGRYPVQGPDGSFVDFTARLCVNIIGATVQCAVRDSLIVGGRYIDAPITDRALGALLDDNQ